MDTLDKRDTHDHTHGSVATDLGGHMAQWEDLFDGDDEEEDEGEEWKREADRPTDAHDRSPAWLRAAYEQHRHSHPAEPEVPQEPSYFRGHGPREPSALALLDRLATRLGTSQDCPA